MGKEVAVSVHHVTTVPKTGPILKPKFVFLGQGPQGYAKTYRVVRLVVDFEPPFCLDDLTEGRFGQDQPPKPAVVPIPLSPWSGYFNPVPLEGLAPVNWMFLLVNLTLVDLKNLDVQEFLRRLEQLLHLIQHVVDELLEARADSGNDSQMVGTCVVTLEYEELFQNFGQIFDTHLWYLSSLHNSRNGLYPLIQDVGTGLHHLGVLRKRSIQSLLDFLEVRLAHLAGSQ